MPCLRRCHAVADRPEGLCRALQAVAGVALASMAAAVGSPRMWAAAQRFTEQAAAAGWIRSVHGPALHQLLQGSITIQ